MQYSHQVSKEEKEQYIFNSC